MRMASGGETVVAMTMPHCIYESWPDQCMSFCLSHVAATRLCGRRARIDLACAIGLGFCK